MSLIFIMQNMMFLFSTMMFMFYYKHILLTLISLEFMMINLLMMMFNFMNMLEMNPFFLSFFLGISICESVIGLSILVYMIRLMGNDYMCSLNIIKW